VGLLDKADDALLEEKTVVLRFQFVFEWSFSGIEKYDFCSTVAL